MKLLKNIIKVLSIVIAMTSSKVSPMNDELLDALKRRNEIEERLRRQEEAELIARMNRMQVSNFREDDTAQEPQPTSSGWGSWAASKLWDGTKAAVRKTADIVTSEAAANAAKAAGRGAWWLTQKTGEVAVAGTKAVASSAADALQARQEQAARDAQIQEQTNFIAGENIQRENIYQDYQREVDTLSEIAPKIDDLTLNITLHDAYSNVITLATSVRGLISNLSATTLKIEGKQLLRDLESLKRALDSCITYFNLNAVEQHVRSKAFAALKEVSPIKERVIAFERSAKPDGGANPFVAAASVREEKIDLPEVPTTPLQNPDRKAATINRALAEIQRLRETGENPEKLQRLIESVKKLGGTVPVERLLVPA